MLISVTHCKKKSPSLFWICQKHFKWFKWLAWKRNKILKKYHIYMSGWSFMISTSHNLKTWERNKRYLKTIQMIYLAWKGEKDLDEILLWFIFAHRKAKLNRPIAKWHSNSNNNNNRKQVLLCQLTDNNNNSNNKKTNHN